MRNIRLLLVSTLALLGMLLSPGVASASTSRALVTYVVVDGDWLSKIASRQCGSVSRWNEIYNLNQGLIGSNPNLIYRGQRLSLPAGCTSVISAPVARSVAGGAWRSPLVSYRITTCYEWRQALYVDGRLVSRAGLHSGLDMSAPGGTRVSTVAAGTVIRSGWRGGYGNAVEISHGGGITSMYAHMSYIYLRTGQRVGPGDSVGRVGSTGSSTGNHLHLGMYRLGAHFNPTPYLEARGVPIRGC